jgi:hypothetical protein
VANDRTIPILPCQSLDDILPFYEALGFEAAFRQVRPNPYLCLNRGDLDLHFCEVAGFDPATSVASVILLVADVGALFDAFAAGLRGTYGKLPLSGIPRITRPRRKQGTTGGFTIVDPGGTWLRVTSAGEPDPAPSSRLDRVLRNAARQADSHGDESTGVRVLETGLARHSDAPAVERVPALVYLAELLVRTGDRKRALSVLADVRGLDLTAEGRDAVARDLVTAGEIEVELM